MMQDTEEIRAWTIEQINRICKLMEIDVPNITFEIIFSRKRDKYDTFGVYYSGDADLVYLNLLMHYDEDHLLYTLTHELNHKRANIESDHGDPFDEKVDQYIEKLKRETEDNRTLK